MKSPFFSIITPVFNGEKYIEETINSVIDQSINDYEYVIVDNLSTDNTSSIISKYSSKIHKIISEKDNGMYDALDKGFIVITGPIGRGKTTIARNLLSSIGDANIVAAQLVTTKLSPDELLELVAAEFKIPLKSNSSKAEVLRNIEAFLIHILQYNK